MIILDKIFRQKDSDFLTILNEIRLNRLSNKTLQVLERKVFESKLLPATYEAVVSVEAKESDKHQSPLKKNETKDSDEMSEISMDIEAQTDIDTENDRTKSITTSAAVKTTSIKYTKLFALNRFVDSYNQTELSKLPPFDGSEKSNQFNKNSRDNDRIKTKRGGVDSSSHDISMRKEPDDDFDAEYNDYGNEYHDDSTSTDGLISHEL